MLKAIKLWGISLYGFGYYLIFLNVKVMYACLGAQLCLTLCDPMDCSPLGSSGPWGFSRQEYWSELPCLPPGDLPNTGIKRRSLTLQADSLPSEPPGKPKNPGMGSLSLLQGLFLTEESNWGLLHYRRILYQLSYQGSQCVSRTLI